MRNYSFLSVAVVLGMALAGPLVCSCSANNDDPVVPEVKKHYPKSDGAVRLMTYNVGSFSKYLTNSTGMVAAMIKEAEADIVGLNELDSVNARHPVNQVKVLADAIGSWNWHFGRAMAFKGGAYGNGVVTPLKIVKSYTVTLAKGSGSEQRSLAVVELEKFVFGAAHLDHKSDEAQISQAEIINNWAKAQDMSKPVFFVGDMNAYPGSQTLSFIRQSWEVISVTDNTFGSKDPTNCIDYIFHYRNSAPVKVLKSSVMTEFDKGDVKEASDHLPVFVDVEFK